MMDRMNQSPPRLWFCDHGALSEEAQKAIDASTAGYGTDAPLTVNIAKPREERAPGGGGGGGRREYGGDRGGSRNRY